MRANSVGSSNAVGDGLLGQKYGRPYDTDLGIDTEPATSARASEKQAGGVFYWMEDKDGL